MALQSIRLNGCVWVLVRSVQQDSRHSGGGRAEAKVGRVEKGICMYILIGFH